MKLHLGKRARRQAERMDAWWAENRQSAPMMFAQEFRGALQAILLNPEAGTAWATRRRPGLRRYLIGRTKNHIYFERRGDTIHVLAVWGAVMGNDDAVRMLAMVTENLNRPALSGYSVGPWVVSSYVASRSRCRWGR